eukprot:13274877-Alexandrium_andersonii.AAC.1
MFVQECSVGRPKKEMMGLLPASFKELFEHDRAAECVSHRADCGDSEAGKSAARMSCRCAEAA